MTEEKLYDPEQLKLLNGIFSIEGEVHQEKLKLMKLEQDAQAKQQSMATIARKRVKPESQVSVIEQHDMIMFEQPSHLLEMMNP